jgi:1-acyl-sn-glycerol-3-phosphate acyltransferase
MLAVAWVFRLKLRWIGKHTLFAGWRRPFMRFLGGMPVDRRSRNGVVQQVVDYFNDSDALILAIAPEGTRGRSELWKSGFYHIAHGAKVPVLLGFLDFGRKVGGVGPALIPTGNIAEDMKTIRAFYDGIEGLYPDKQGEVRLKEELEAEAPISIAAE